jgi:hypothetical protein
MSPAASEISAHYLVGIAPGEERVRLFVGAFSLAWPNSGEDRATSEADRKPSLSLSLSRN